MAKRNRRQHFISRCYLRNFAEPMFGDDLCVYDISKRRLERRTPQGVGWYPHIYSMIDMEGNRTDEFDQFLKREVEDPAAPALKKLATGAVLGDDERCAVARFVALTAVRSPELLTGALPEHLNGLAPTDRAKLEDLAGIWWNSIGKQYDSNLHSEFLKPSSFGAIWKSTQSLLQWLLESQWHLIQTTRERPFVTSDRPVFAKWVEEKEVRFASFPVSSEFAIVFFTGGQFHQARDRSNDVAAINRQSMDGAKEFIVACKEDFPGDEYLARLGTFA